MNPVQIKKKIQDLAVNLKEAEEKNAQPDHALHATIAKLIEKHGYDKFHSHLQDITDEMKDRERAKKSDVRVFGEYDDAVKRGEIEPFKGHRKPMKGDKGYTGK